MLEIDCDRRSPSVGQIPGTRADSGATTSLEPDHVGTHVGEHHRGELSGADARDLDDLDPSQRTRRFNRQRE
jgi:hypothetical protein